MNKKLLFLLVGLLFLSSCKDEEIKKKPVASFSFTVKSEFAPVKVIFENTSIEADKYVWDFGDGSAKSYSDSPTHTYQKSGIYTVVLTAIGKGGNSKISKKIEIKDPKPLSDFTYRMNGNSAPLTVYFTNISSNATEYIWNFGDGSSPNSQKSPSHYYTQGGVYTVTLTAIGKGGRGTSSKTINIQKKPDPIPNFSFEINGRFAPIKVKFTNASSNANQYLWDFGDGSAKSTLTAPNHTFYKGGIYTVTLTAIRDNVRKSVSKTVNIPNAPTKLQINKITLLLYPKLNGSQTSWDINTAPDIYWGLTNEVTNQKIKGGEYSNVGIDDLPITYSGKNLPYLITDINQKHSLDFWDRDGGLNGDDDYMGGFEFTPSSYRYKDYPSEILLTGYLKELGVMLSVTWK